MFDIEYEIKGQPVKIHVVENEHDDLDRFVEFVKRNPVLAFDTETTGLDIYSNEFKIRTAQFGNSMEAFVLPVERSLKVAWYARNALEHLQKVIIQNAPYDIQAVNRHWGMGDHFKDWRKVRDTKIYAHLVDSRSAADGGIGHSLGELTAHYIDRNVALEVKASMKTLADQTGIPKSEIWSKIDLLNPTYLLYAGMDTILTMRLYHILKDRVPHTSKGLLGYEHNLARICANIEARGILLDGERNSQLIKEFTRVQSRSEKAAAKLGVDNIRSTKQVIGAFTALGVIDFERTEKGNESANDEFLMRHFKNRPKTDAEKLAKAIIEGKRAAKWRATYFERFASSVDSSGYIHPNIISLATRTARMVVLNPAIQTLPAAGKEVREVMCADDGHVWTSIDYATQELRMAAALSQDEVMLQEFLKPMDEVDLHQITADAAGVDRKVGKMANFLIGYGGGYRALAKKAKITERTAKQTIEGFRGAFSTFDKWSKKTADQAKSKGYITTSTGRKIIVDVGRWYAGGNYAIQSASRDITGSAIVKLDQAGLSPYIVMAMHDELDFSFPKEDAKEMAAEAAKHMTIDFNGVQFPTDLQIGDQAWGSIADFKDKASVFNMEEDE